jgi:nucleotide-binding universal stress UspA family protein
MNKTILVPLDGSPAGEHALAIGASLAVRTKAALRLVHVRQPIDHDFGHSSPRKEQDYLDMQAWRIRQTTHLTVCVSVLEGPVVETIVEHAQSVTANLIVMTTHGRGPFSRFWLGSVADGLIRRAPAPLIVLRPHDEKPNQSSGAHWPPRHILVALDGSTFAETVLPRTVEFAKLLNADLTLVRVVKPNPVFMPSGVEPQPIILDSTALEELKTQARTYLESIADGLRKDGQKVKCRILVDDRVAPTILEEAREYDLIAVATHGRHGISRMLLGSVTDKIVRGAPGPVLIIPPQPH